MRTYLDCLPCFLRQALGAARAATADERIQRRVLDTVAQMMPSFALDITPPEIAQHVYRCVYEITGNEDPFQQAKRESNLKALSLYDKSTRLIESADDPLLAACKLSIAGNSLDLGPYAVTRDIETVIEKALSSPLGYDGYAAFRSRISDATTILYLADNAGEIVFDKLLIEHILVQGDQEITVAVRETPIINDATLVDAEMVGLPSLTRVISNGSGAPATILSQCSPEFRSLFGSVDMIIAKGQGNYESLSEQPANIFFLLQAKCPVVAVPLGVNVSDSVLKPPSA